MDKLLVVEPDDELRSRYGEAFDLCEHDHPDLVLLDPHLGRFFGLTKGRWVAEQSHHCSSAPVVVMAEECEQQELESFGPDAVVPRVAKPEDLVEKISSLLSV